MSEKRFLINKSNLNNLQTRKKAKKYLLVGIPLLLNNNTKSPKT